MGAQFSIDVDPAQNLVRITMKGLFLAPAISAFLEARREAHRKLTCGPNEHVTINDVRDAKIQPQESVAAFREILADPAYRSRRLAFVVGRTLTRQQLLRALDSRQGQCFDTAEEAEAWLFEPDAAETQVLARKIRVAG